MQRGDQELLRRLAHSLKAEEVPAATLILLADSLEDSEVPRDWVRRREMYAEAQLAHPGDFRVRLRLGQLAREDGLPDQASVQLAVALGMRPESILARVLLALALAEEGRREESRRILEAGRHWHDQNPDLHTQRGLNLRRMGKYAEAEATYRRVFELREPKALDHVNLGVAVEFQGRLEEAVREYRSAMELEPGCARAHENLLGVLSKRDDEEELRLSIEDMFTQLGESAVAFRQAGQAWFRLGNFDAALGAFEQTLELDPEDLLALNLRSFLLAAAPEPELRDVEESLALAKAVTRLNNEFFNSWFCLCVARCRNEQWEAAVDAFDTGRSLRSEKENREDPGSGPVSFFVAIAHAQIGQSEEAQRWYDQGERWLESSRNDPVLRSWREIGLNIRDEARAILAERRRRDPR